MADDDWDDDDNESDYMDESTMRSMQSNDSSPKVEVFKRRANQLNPNIKISEITKPIRTHIAEKDKKAIPKRTEVFKFHCEGDIINHDAGDGKHVEWKATFDKPIEQLIYPSLQRFDNETFEEKRKAYKMLHGQHETVVPVAGSPTGALTDGLKLDLLPESAQPAADLMFLHTPKWTLTVSPAKARASSPSPPRHKHRKKDDQGQARSLLEEIDVEGEKYLRAGIKKRYHQTLEAAIQEQKERELIQSPFYIPPTRKSPTTSRVRTPVLDNGDRVYANLVERSSLAPDPMASSLHRLSDLPPTEAAYAEQTKHLKPMTPVEHTHLLPAVLYYRVRNSLQVERMKEEEENDKRKMTYLAPSVHPQSRKASNAFSRRVSELKSTRNSLISVDEMYALRGEDSLLPPPALLTQAHIVPSMHTIQFARLNRAVANTLSGLDKKLLPPVGSSGGNTNSSYNKGMREGRWERGSEEGGSTSRPSSSSIYKAQHKHESFRAELAKREAQDKLILHQLEAGLLPETFIKASADAEGLTVNLSKYGIGDDRGLCLGKCLEGLNHLESLGLSDNRLTAVSLPTIIKFANASSLMHLDLSFNDLHDQGAKAIALHFKHTTVALTFLDLCNCNLLCSDVSVICQNLKTYKNCLDELYLSNNKIASTGAAEICAYLASNMCILSILDVSWNTIGDGGAVEFANVLGQHNKSLVRLNLAANAINDFGGQRLMDSIGFNTNLREVILSQNSLSDKTGFVVAQVLQNHPSMNKLDLSLNPIGEAGARSIFRTILRGLTCFVVMRNCSYAEKHHIYKHTYPTHDNPYVLDLSEPYNRAVVYELLYKFQEDPTHCGFEQMFYREAPKGSEVNIQLGINPLLEEKCKLLAGSNYLVNKVCLKSTNELYVVPRSGILKFHFVQAVFVPTVHNIIQAEPLSVLKKIVEKGVTENDKKMWLFLICQDLYFTTQQAQNMIVQFKESKTVGAGGLTTLDILKSLWKFLVDTENMFDFLISNADPAQRKDLIYSLTLKRYRFNWSNPTGHWTLSLSDKVQRAVMMQIMAINNSESEYSKTLSGRQDTSQLGNWNNFRNCQYSVNGTTTEIGMDKDFLKNLPATGTLDFDYVSTTRPQSAANNTIPTLGSFSFDEGEGLIAEGEEGEGERALTPPTSAAAVSRQPFQSVSSPTHAPARRSTMGQAMTHIKVISDEQFYIFMKKVGLSHRTKISSANAIFILMDLQLASTKYYFSCHQINILLEAFQDTWDIQSKVVVCMFSRIKDLHNMDTILRNLNSQAQQDIIKRLGCLNLINPLKISFDYILPMKYLDNRILVVTLMELASIESADQIQEDPHTELPIQTLYGSYTRALNEVRPEVMKFTFADFGIRTNNISWSTRRELLKKFLVGTQPLDEDMFKIITLFKEMEAANALTRGPIDLQYASFQKTMKGTAGRTTKTTKSLVSAMRNLQNTRKSM